jgi:hypothetical protein
MHFGMKSILKNKHNHNHTFKQAIHLLIVTLFLYVVIYEKTRNKILLHVQVKKLNLELSLLDPVKNYGQDF